MTRSTLVRLVLLGAAAIGTLLWLMFNGLFGSSQVVVLRSNTEYAVVLDDDAPLEHQREELVLEVRPGTHSLRFDSNKPLSFKVKGGGERWVVAAPGQCLVVVDATRLFQHSTALAQARTNGSLARTFVATIAERWTDGQPHKLGKGTWSNLPASVKGGAVMVVKALDCEDAKVGDADLLDRLGFGG